MARLAEPDMGPLLHYLRHYGRLSVVIGSCGYGVIVGLADHIRAVVTV